MLLDSILLTGGAGYIGSSIAYYLLKQGKNVIIVDNFENSTQQNIDNLPNKENLKIYNVDCCNYQSLEHIFKSNKIHTVIHLAGHKAVAESISSPLKYYENNLLSTMNILKCVSVYGIAKMIFSSSATVYGTQESPLYETTPIGKGITNPYGMTKYMGECMIMDVAKTIPKTDFIILRYFNPVGSVENGLICENPRDIPNNLMPVLIRSIREQQTLKVFGNDYGTHDGTPARDFIHIEDLAKGHISAIGFENPDKKQNLYVFNLGTGKSHTVMEVIHTFEKVNKMKISYEIVGRREGDLENVYCDPTVAREILGWKAEKTLTDMCDFRFLFQN